MVARLRDKTRISAPTYQGPFTGGIVALAVSLCLSLGSLAAAASVGTNNITGLIIVNFSLFLFSVGLLLALARNGGLSCVIFGIYYICFLSFPGMLHISSNQYPFYNMTYAVDDVDKSALILFIFSASALIGQLIAYQYNNRENKIYNEQPETITIRFLPIIIVIAMSSALVGLIGPGVFVAKRSDEIFVDFGGASELIQLLIEAARISGVIALIACLHRWIYAGRTTKNTVLVVLTLFLNSVVNFPLGISRFSLFGSLLIIMHLMFDVTRPRFKLLFTFALFVGIGTVFPLISFLQRGPEGEGFEFDFIGYFQRSGDLDGFQSMINATILVARDGLSWGWQLLSALLTAVPRSIWPSKGLPTGSIAADAAGYVFLNISMPLPSELYVDFGYAGVAVGAALIGFSLARLDGFYNSSTRRRNISTILFVGGVCGYLIIISRGTLIGVLAPIGLYFVSAFLVTRAPFIERRRSHRS